MEAWLMEKGLDRATATSKKKQQAALTSRQKKVSIDRDALHKTWQTQAQSLGISFQKIPYQKQNTLSNNHVSSEEAAAQALQYAIKHLTERQSIIFERELINTALQHAVGLAKLTDIEHDIIRKIEKCELIEESPRYNASEDIDIQSSEPLTRHQWIEQLRKSGISCLAK